MSQSDEISEAKRSIRKEKLHWRSSLPAAEARLKSQRIADTLKMLPEYASAKTILFYVSAKPNEVDTHSLIREALSNGVRVLVPATDFDHNKLTISEIMDMGELVPARFGLLEPDPNSFRPADPAEADVIIVPGVAFDRECRRVGFGGGYYDWLLSRTHAAAIALGYEGQLMDKVPADSTDMPVDVLVTESRVYRARSRRS